MSISAYWSWLLASFLNSAARSVSIAILLALPVRSEYLLRRSNSFRSSARFSSRRLSTNRWLTTLCPFSPCLYNSSIPFGYFKLYLSAKSCALCLFLGFEKSSASESTHSTKKRSNMVAPITSACF